MLLQNVNCFYYSYIRVTNECSINECNHTNVSVTFCCASSKGIPFGGRMSSYYGETEVTSEKDVVENIYFLKRVKHIVHTCVHCA